MTTGWQATKGGDAVVMALGLALALHAAVIGLVHFDFLEGVGDRVPSSLDVILVKWATEEEPEQADFFAQATQRGGGESPEVERPAEEIPFSSELPDQLFEQEMLETAPIDQPEPLPEVVHLDEAVLEAESIEAVEFMETPRIDATDIRDQSLAMARLSPDQLSDRRDLPERPRRKFISANTREHLYAGYMRSWVAKVERVGNMNYPEQARRQNLAGSLVLSVDVMADGSVAHIRMLRSSGYDVLDEAAVRIVRLSAPFAPFPEEIRSDYDVLTITRTWQFSATGRLH